MARIRTIKPEFCTSEQVAECSPNARLLFVLLWMFCDDGGRHPASIRRLKMECFPADSFTDKQMQNWIDELIQHGLLEHYLVDGQGFWQVTGWHHQKIDQPTYKYPNREGFVERSAPKRRTHGERSPPERSGDDTERNGAERSGVERKGDESKGVDVKTGAVAPKKINWDKAVVDCRKVNETVPVNTDQDQSLILKAVAISQTSLGEDWLWDSVEAVRFAFSRDKPPETTRAGYLHGVLASKCKELGKKFNPLLASVEVPAEVLEQFEPKNGPKRMRPRAP